MRVCMLIWNYWPGPEGGTERQCRRLAQELPRQGMECLVLTHWNTFREEREHEDASARVRRVGWFGPVAGMLLSCIRGLKAMLVRTREAPGPRSLELGNTGESSAWGPSIPVLWLDRFFFMIGIWRYVRLHSREMDVIHVHEAHWIAGFGAWLGARFRIPVVVKEASFPVFLPVERGVPFRRAWERWRCHPDYIAQSDPAAAELAERGVKESRITVIPNGVDIPSGTSDVRTSREVLYVGNLYQGVGWKAFDVLFDAWQRVVAADPSARLVVVGGGDLAWWREYVGRLGLAASVEFVGRSEAPAQWFRRAGLFVLPSRREGMSNALLEAQSWGVPCVVSDIPGNKAVVEDNVNGLVVPVNNAEALSSAIRLLLGDPVLRARLGKAARARAEREFAMATMVQQVANTYGTLRAPSAS